MRDCSGLTDSYCTSSSFWNCSPDLYYYIGPKPDRTIAQWIGYGENECEDAAILKQSPCISESENHEDVKLLQKLCKMGQETQVRIKDLLMVIENKDVTVALIQENEDFNHAILG